MTQKLAVIQFVTAMRDIINISLPPDMSELVRHEVKVGHYASTSEFFRHLIRLWNTKKVVRHVRKSQREFTQGKGKVLTSLRDLR